MKNILLAIICCGFISCCKDSEIVNPDNQFQFYKLNSNTNETITDISFINNSEGIICGESGFCSKTTNGGALWTTLNTGIPFSFVSAFMFDNQNYFIGRNGIYRTTNAGNTFSEIGSLSSASSIVSKIYFQTINIGFISKSGSIYQTTDGGLTWFEKYNTGVYYGLTNLLFTSQNIAYASGGRTFDQINQGEIVKTIDGGNTWNKILSTVNITSIYFTSDSIGFYSNYNKEIFITKDGGLSWSKITTLNYLPLSIVFENEFQGYVSTQEGKILKTTNRGQSWEIVYENNEPIVKIIKTPNSIFGVGGNGLVVKSK